MMEGLYIKIFMKGETLFKLIRKEGNFYHYLDNGIEKKVIDKHVVEEQKFYTKNK